MSTIYLFFNDLKDYKCNDQRPQPGYSKALVCEPPRENVKYFSQRAEPTSFSTHWRPTSRIRPGARCHITEITPRSGTEGLRPLSRVDGARQTAKCVLARARATAHPDP